MKRYDLRHLKDDFYDRMVELIEKGLKADEVGIFLFEVGDFSSIQKSADIIKDAGHDLMNSLKFNEVDWTVVVKKVDEATRKAREEKKELARVAAQKAAEEKAQEDKIAAETKAKAEAEKAEAEEKAKAEAEAEAKAKEEAEAKAKAEEEAKAAKEKEAVKKAPVKKATTKRAARKPKAK